MNKYLLLRDNKQSGPYTGPEIIAKGIKAYDLVWLEGKSAAWRYPSEIEELKAYAPAVEEQPFDRFYRKPEEMPSEKKSAFEPVIAEETVRRKIVGESKKIYINFPGGPKKVPVYQEPGKDNPAPIAPKERIIENEPQIQHVAPDSMPADRKLLYGVIAACFILMMIISVLIMNYGNQRSSIKQLNDMVQQMEKRQNAQNLAAKAALASRVIPAAPVIETPAASLTEGTAAPAKEALPAPDKKFEQVTSRQENILPKLPNEAVKEQPQAPVQQTVAAPKKEEAPKEDLFKQVSLKSNKFKTGMLGGISNLQFVLTNKSAHELQRVSVEIKYFSPEKKLVKTQTIYFEKVAPGAQPVMDVPKSNRGVSIDYAVTDIKS